MAYEGEQSQQPQSLQRPYNGPAGHRPLQRPHHFSSPASSQPTQGFSQLQYDEYGGYYDVGAMHPSQDYAPQDYHPPYRDSVYHHGPSLPPGQAYQSQAYFGTGTGNAYNGFFPGRGRPMLRGWPGRAASHDPGRGGWYGPRGGFPGRPYGPGNGRPTLPAPPIAYERAAHSDTELADRRPPTADSSFDGGPFPSYPGQQRTSYLEEEQRFINQLSDMAVHSLPNRNIHGIRPRAPSIGNDFDRSRGPPSRAPSVHQAHADQAGPSLPLSFGGQARPANYGAGFRPAGYGHYPSQHEFGSPERSMTMPDPNRRTYGPPQRQGSFPLHLSMGHGPPPRPSSAQDQLPLVRRTYPPDHVPGSDAYRGVPPSVREQHPPDGVVRSSHASLDDNFISYSDDPRWMISELDGSGVTSQPAPQQDPRAFSGHPPFQNGGNQVRGPMRRPSQRQELSRTKSQPNLRQADTAAIGIATFAPPVPVLPRAASTYQAYRPPHLRLANFPPMPAGNSPPIGTAVSAYDGPPIRQALHYGVGPLAGGGEYNAASPQSPPPLTTPFGYGSRPASEQAGSGPARQAIGSPLRMSDPTHLVPLRQGSIASGLSVISANDRPTPVRNYNGLPSSDGASIHSNISGGASIAAPASTLQTKPAPVRNYSIVTPTGTGSGLAATGGTPTMTTAEPPQNPPVTLDELEQLRLRVKADANDRDTGLVLAKKLIEATTVLVPEGGADSDKNQNRVRERFLLDAHKTLKKLCSAQMPDAMFLMADSYGRGLFGPEPDNKEAFALYQSAAKLGHAAAAYRTAVCCEIGNDEGGGTRKDPIKAMQWYRRAATLGDTPAMYKLGMILLKGLLGQPRDSREGVSWLQRAAERANAENPHALHELGLLYESAGTDDAIGHDEAYAFSLFAKAAELGYKFSQFRLGCAYEYGLLGCPVDPRHSIPWYSRAAAQEEHQAELALSGWYLTGSESVLAQSDTEAYLWARKAALAGLAKAEYAMGYFTEVGIGVTSNLDDAKRWYWRAAAQDFPKARERLEDLKRTGKAGPRQREGLVRSKVGKQQEGDCVIM